MDFVKKAMSGGSKDQKATDGKASGSQGQDYIDKGFAFASSKAGFNMNKDTQEKVTDGARSAYEKQTGNKVDPKYSN
ncbi:hypothetical protein FZEAL_2433 [Fusarium zealandicum]|uniref:Uncharacterized protein n=1 Tax=Fusarium zealandicum TaxID=1053134 RepID=A0A8H4URI6_9HYPO|nr:hypothetical protein FZEAL_2433 [Fusarium zealandicum]